MVCGDESLGSEPQSLYHCQGYIFRGTGERNRWYALLMTANKPETALYRAPTLSLLASHGGISSCVCIFPHHRLNATAFIFSRCFEVRHLFEGGVYSRVAFINLSTIMPIVN